MPFSSERAPTPEEIVTDTMRGVGVTKDQYPVLFALACDHLSISLDSFATLPDEATRTRMSETRIENVSDTIRVVVEFLKQYHRPYTRAFNNLPETILCAGFLLRQPSAACGNAMEMHPTVQSAQEHVSALQDFMAKRHYNNDLSFDSLEWQERLLGELQACIRVHHALITFSQPMNGADNTQHLNALLGIDAYVPIMASRNTDLALRFKVMCPILEHLKRGHVLTHNADNFPSNIAVLRPRSA